MTVVGRWTSATARLDALMINRNETVVEIITRYLKVFRIDRDFNLFKRLLNVDLNCTLLLLFLLAFVILCLSVFAFTKLNQKV